VQYTVRLGNLEDTFDTSRRTPRRVNRIDLGGNRVAFELEETEKPTYGLIVGTPQYAREARNVVGESSDVFAKGTKAAGFITGGAGAIVAYYEFGTAAAAVQTSLVAYNNVIIGERVSQNLVPN